MIRIAAVGDLHAGADSRQLISPGFSEVAAVADVLLIAGDLTRIGTVEEIDVLVDELSAVTIPKIAVLGNHDYHSNQTAQLVDACEQGGITILDGEATTLTLPGGTLGVAGVKGFGGGFPGMSLSMFGEPEMKQFAETAATEAARLGQALDSLGPQHLDHLVALLHYSPIRGTLEGEPPEIFPFLGSGALAEVIDDTDVQLVIHGHAHHGLECGTTPGGRVVRNVAQPVIGACYRVYQLPDEPDPPFEGS